VLYNRYATDTQLATSPAKYRIGNMDIFIQQIINGLVLGSVYAIIALGYTMVYGILGIINFAHGDVLTVTC
jgi:ABC-type branched-subunit amino acid transport system permease subunit